MAANEARPAGDQNCAQSRLLLVPFSHLLNSPDRLALSEQIKTLEPPRHQSLDPRIPRDLETIVLKAIEKDPRARYASAEALAKDLRRILDDEPILARRVGTAERYLRWARRNPVIAALGGVLTAVLVVMTIASWVAAGRVAALATMNGREKLTAQTAQAQAELQRDRAVQHLCAARIGQAELDIGLPISSTPHGSVGLLRNLGATA
jgi:hypothetical protein